MIFRDAGVFSWFHLLLAGGGLLWALIVAVLLALRWKVPPFLGTAPLAAVPFLLIVGAWWSNRGIEAALGGAEPSTRATLLAAGLSELLNQAVMPLLSLPTAILLGLGGLAAGVRAPRRWGAVVGIFLLAGLTAILPLSGFFLYGDTMWVLITTGVLVLGVLPLALSFAHNHPAHNGPEAGITAAAAWLNVVATLPLAMTTSSWSRGFAALASVDPAQRGKIVTALTEEVGAFSTVAWLMLVLGAIPLAVAVFRPAPELTEEEVMRGDGRATPWRSLGGVLVIGLWVLWLIAWISLDPSSQLTRIGIAS